MNTSIVNNELDNNNSSDLVLMSHEKKSCEFSLVEANSLIVDALNINSFLISGALDDEKLLIVLHEEMQSKLDTLKCLVNVLQFRQDKDVNLVS